MTHSRDLGVRVRNQGPTILLPQPAKGALTTETQTPLLLAMDDARSVPCERQAFRLDHRTRTLYYALNIDPGGGGWYNGGKLKKGGEQGKCIKHLYILDIFL